MNGDINEILKSVLQNPEAISGVMKLAQGMMNNVKDSGAEIKNDNSDRQRDNGSENDGMDKIKSVLPSLPSSFAYDEDRVRLLKALRPYLGENRRKKIDNIISIMTLLKMFAEKR